VEDGVTDDKNNTIHTGVGFKNSEGTVEDSASVEVVFNSAGTTTSGATETKVGKIDLTGLNVTEATTGVYRYTLKQTTLERNSGDKNVYADKENAETVYQVDLYVDDGDIIAIKVRTPDGSSKAEPIFKNKVVNEDTLYITNYIDGDMKKDEDHFEFQLTIPEGGVPGGVTLNEGTLIYAKITNAYDKTKDVTKVFFVPATPAEGEAYATTYTDADGNEYTNTVDLYDGDMVTITGLPVGLKYIISMNDANDYGYTSRYYDYKDFTEVANVNHEAWESNVLIENASTEDKDTACGGTMTGTVYTNNLTKAHHVEFVSIKGISNTGISMDSIPYAVMFVAAAAIAVLAVAKKKTDR
jgi:hypothetical protein